MAEERGFFEKMKTGASDFMTQCKAVFFNEHRNIDRKTQQQTSAQLPPTKDESKKEKTRLAPQRGNKYGT